MEQLGSRLNGDSVARQVNAATPVAAIEKLAEARASLIIAHPGHELCVYGWCQLTRPAVFIFTDGSGRTGKSRMASSTHLLEKLGCTPDPVSGRLTDKDVYRALIDRNIPLFTALANEIAMALANDNVDYVVGDAREGFNPVHDLCRLIIDAAVEIAGRSQGRSIPSFAFRLDWRKETDDRWQNGQARTLTLDQDSFSSKLAAARDYNELEMDVKSALESNGVDYFRTERLEPVPRQSPNHDQTALRPYYEEYGERQVALGLYDQVIRYNEHLRPVAEALALAAQRSF